MSHAWLMDGTPPLPLTYLVHKVWCDESADVLCLLLQVKKLKAQLEQKTQRNGTNSSSPDGEIVENGADPNKIELQSKCA